DGAGLTAHGGEAGVIGRPPMPLFDRRIVGAVVAAAGEETVVVVTDPRQGGAVERRRLADRATEEALLEHGPPDLNGPRRWQRVEKRHEDVAAILVVVEAEGGAVPLAPGSDEAGLEHRDDV